MERPLSNLEALAEKLDSARISRRLLLKRTAVLGVSLPTMGALIAACADDDDVLDDDPEDVAAEEPDDDTEEVVETDDEPVEDDTAEDEPDEEDDVEVEADEPDDDELPEEQRYGGSLYATIVGDPPQLDMMAGTQILMRYVATHMVENLFTRDDEFQIIPDLADTHEVSDDGLTNTVVLRQGVPFHNGEEMTSADVIASIERFMDISGMGNTFAESVDSIEEVDDYTVEVHMNTPLGTFAPMLASHMGGGCPIYPASVIDEAEEGMPINDVVSTGPYRLVEWVPDTHVHTERFEDYAARDEEPLGYGGGKKQYLDEIYFVPIPDEASRIAGLQAGDFHFLDDISPDHIATFEGDPNVVADPEPFTWMSLVLNTAEGIMSDIRMRQALQACLNHEEILRAGYGDHFRLDPSLILQEMVWHTEAGGELYDQRDPDRAMQLMDEAGYDGEEITFLTTNEYQDRYNASLMAAQQMRDVGMNVVEDVYDWATVGERRADPELWDLFYTSIGGIDPALTVFVASNTWPGWWDTDRKVDLAAQLREETDFDVRYELFEQLQELFYEEVPVIKLGDIYQIYARSTAVRGFVPLIQQSAFLWNVWLDER
jgi:peptide/nickel transport system substrate-binding protein